MTVTVTVADAERLVEAGDALAAIDVLVAANRAERHADLEGALVRARHRAFAEVTGTGAPATWPRLVPAGADAPMAPSSAPVALPEIGRDALGADALTQGIVGHGALVVRGLTDDDTVGRLVDGIDRAFEGCDAFGDGATADDTRPFFDPLVTPKGMPGLAMKRRWVRDGGGVLTADSPRVLFDLLEVLAASGAVAAIEEYLGERPVLSANKCTLRRVTANSGTNWHQDGAFLGEGIRTVNVWLALSDCGVDAPGIEIVPRRLPKVLATGTHGALFDWSVGEGLVAEVSAPEGTAMPRFAAGDALIFDDLNLHRTGVDPSMTKVRYAIETWFFAGSCYPGGQIPLVV